MEELWADVEGFPSYTVSNYGYVLNMRTGRLLKMQVRPDGFRHVTLSNRGVVQEFYVHQLVAAAFLRQFKPGMHVYHINRDKSDNSAHNLTMKGGSTEIELERPGKRESWGRPIRVIETGEVFRTVRECARYLGGDYSSIYACLSGKRKTHLGYSFEYYGE